MKKPTLRIEEQKPRNIQRADIAPSSGYKVPGYRPVTAGISVNFDDQSIANSLRDTTQRIGRKAVLIVAASGMPLATRIAEAHKDWVSDIVVLNASHQSDMPLGVRTHFISSGWSLLFAMAALPQVLRNIQIELIEAPSSGAPESGYCGSPWPPHTKHQLSAEGEQK
jgi:hypothetical protein